MKTIFILLASCALSFAQITLPPTMEIDGKQYQEVAYMSHDAAKVKFSHAGGIAFLDISAMPDGVREQLGYSQEAADIALAEYEAEKLATAQAIQQKRESRTQSIVQQDAGRLENIQQAEKEKLRESIAMAERQLKELKKQIRDQDSGNTPEGRARIAKKNELYDFLNKARKEMKASQ